MRTAIPTPTGRGVGASRMRCCTTWSTRTCCCSAAHQLHRRTGVALEAALGTQAQAPVVGETLNPQRLAELEALGHHWSLSPDKVRGAQYLLSAGDRARAVHANDDALRHYERALRTLDEAVADTAAAADQVEVVQLDVRERLADLFGLQGRHADALAHYGAVQQAAERRGESLRVARVLRKVGGQHWEAGDRERAGACLMLACSPG